MMMMLGLFPFMLETAPYQTMRRRFEEQWASKNRIGRGPAYQYVGHGEDTITLEGSLIPEITGNVLTLEALRLMAKQGYAWILIAGTFQVFGKFFIKSVEENRTHLRGDGSARKIDFTVNLVRYWEDDTTVLGNIMDSIP